MWCTDAGTLCSNELSYLASSRPYFLMTCRQTSKDRWEESKQPFRLVGKLRRSSLCLAVVEHVEPSACKNTNGQIRCRLPLCLDTPLTCTHSAEFISRKSLLRQTKSLLCGVLAGEHHDRFLATGMFGQKGGHVQHLSWGDVTSLPSRSSSKCLA